MRYGIALGSNLGDRLANLRAAAAGLRSRGLEIAAHSSIYESAPVDCAVGDPLYYNAVLEAHGEWTPEGLLDELHAIELSLGRPAERTQNAPRTIDLDLLYADEETRDSTRIQLPHPRLAVRRFVLVPLAEIRPHLRLPGTGQTVAEMLERLQTDEPQPTPLSTTQKLDRLGDLKRAAVPIVALTAYDYPTGRLLDEAGVDIVLVGDSLGMVVLGFEDTTEVTLDAMIHHTAAVRRGVKGAPLVADLPYQTFENPDQAVASAQRLVAAGADAVKLEGGTAQLAQVEAIIAEGIAIIGHIGMLPQQVRKEGGYKKKGKTDADSRQLVQDAEDLQRAGAVAIVLEGIVPKVATRITASVGIPTIGIGSGLDCDGQILVTHDLIGAYPWFRPPFAKARADVAGEITRAAEEFSQAVRGSS